MRAHRPFLFQHSVSTDEAYNNWPGPAANGKSLYTFNSSGSVAAVKVSFNRPYFIDTDSHYFSQVGVSFLLRWEVMMLRWIEKQGYDVTYCTNVDVHENASLLLSHQAFLSVGHDEYWSWEMRANVEAARDKGVKSGILFRGSLLLADQAGNKSDQRSDRSNDRGVQGNGGGWIIRRDSHKRPDDESVPYYDQLAVQQL